MKWNPRVIPRFTFTARRITQQLDGYRRPTQVIEEFLVENSSSPQPVTMEDNVPLPEGLSDSELYKIYTTTPLKGVEEGTPNMADRVMIEGLPYAVVRCKKWSANVQSHYEVYIAKEPNV